jgi:hypothetical protein
MCISISLSAMALVGPVYAQASSTSGADPFSYTCDSSVAGKTDFCKNVQGESSKSLVFGDKSLMYRIAQIIVYLVGATSVLMIIIGGLRYVISAGDSNGVQGAKNTILYALVGLVVAVAAQFIVTFVLGKFI